MAYVHIRGIASIPTLLSLVAQAACIGAKDSVSPMKAVGLVAVFNIFLDWLFVGPLKKGVAGAAFATAIAQLDWLVVGPLKKGVAGAVIATAVAQYRRWKP
ncbi:hypothetical protein T484DRAFT_1826395 [Baffinella frigidus]|nr:hypothetical protein T484DRAFT_1826395 [Cryptophyta sp. CCMP2293]